MDAASVSEAGAAIELDFLEKKLRRLVMKLEKHGVHLEIFADADIVYGRELGRGGEGVVHRCVVQYAGLPIEAAAKRVIKNTVDTISITLDEIELLCLARHPIIDTTLRVFGVAATPDPTDPRLGQLVIVTEIGIMNCLQLYQRTAVPLHVTYDLWRHLAAAVHTMHTRKIIHRDLKPENILITTIVRDEVGAVEKVDCRIIDLGMGLRLCSERLTAADDIVGTTGYHAPEVLSELPYDARADIFMLGVTFAVLLMRPSVLQHGLKPVLQRLHDVKLKWVHPTRIFDELIQPQFSAQHSISPRIRNMLCAMLQNQQRRTITLLEVVATCHQEAALQQQLLWPQRPFRSEYICEDSGFCSDQFHDSKRVERSNDGAAPRPPIARPPRSASRCVTPCRSMRLRSEAGSSLSPAPSPSPPPSPLESPAFTPPRVPCRRASKDSPWVSARLYTTPGVRRVTRAAVTAGVEMPSATPTLPCGQGGGAGAGGGDKRVTRSTVTVCSNVTPTEGAQPGSGVAGRLRRTAGRRSAAAATGGGKRSTTPGGIQGATTGRKRSDTPRGKQSAIPGERQGATPGGNQGTAPGGKQGTTPGGKQGTTPGGKRGRKRVRCIDVITDDWAADRQSKRPCQLAMLFSASPRQRKGSYSTGVNGHN